LQLFSSSQFEDGHAFMVRISAVII